MIARWVCLALEGDARRVVPIGRKGFFKTVKMIEHAWHSMLMLVREARS